MLTIEKAVKLLDDFHWEQFREYLKKMSIRSYYPLALVDAINRDIMQEQTSTELYRKVYGDPPGDEKDMKKLFQLAHYTFRQTAFLAKNYPTYLAHNLSRTQHLINTGQLADAIHVAEMLRSVAEKTEDFSTELQVLQIQAQTHTYLNAHQEAARCFERMSELMIIQTALSKMHQMVSQRLKSKGKPLSETEHNEQLSYFAELANSSFVSVSIMARMNIAYLRYLQRDKEFFLEENFNQLLEVEKDLENNDHLLFPFLYNLKPKIHFLKLHYRIRQLDFDNMLKEAEQITEDGKSELFWNSFVNIPEVNSISIQSSHLVSNYYAAYRKDYELPNDIQERVSHLIERCEILLANPVLEEQFVERYVSMTAVYAGLLLLDSPSTQVEKSTQTLESLLLFFQQIPFKLKLDAIYTTLIMGYFSLARYDDVEKTYRRYKKTAKGKTINPENDLTLQGFYFASKWLENGRQQYAKKLWAILSEIKQNERLKVTTEMFKKLVDYFEIPVL